MTDFIYKPLSKASDEFIPKNTDFLRRIYLYGKRKLLKAEASGAGDVDILYTVPAGKMFFLISATLNIHNETEGTSAGYAMIENEVFMYLRVPDGLFTANRYTYQVTSINPVYPIMMVPGEKLQVGNNSAVAITDLSAYGYEIDSEIFYKDY